MEETATRLSSKSDDPLNEIGTIQFTDARVTVDKELFASYDDNEIIEEEKLCCQLSDQYSVTLPSFCQDTLDQALLQSLFHSTNPRPLALHIYDDRILATQIFNETILCSESINSYLAEQFVLWSWNLTKDNYYELLSIVSTYAGEEVAAIIDSSPTQIYPLLVCLIFDRGEIKVESIIQGVMSESEVFTLLIQTRNAFGARFELPDTSGLRLTNIAVENWSIPESTLTQVTKESDEFRRVAADFCDGASSIVSIHRIENNTWLMQYLNQKQMVDARIRDNETEKLLFHGCPYEAAEEILEKRFDHDRIGRNGSSYGHGFYFSASRVISDRYAQKHPCTGEKRILMCRVLVGRSCLGSSTTITCPMNYDSTSDESSIYVVYSNRHVLPEYLITYK